MSRLRRPAFCQDFDHTLPGAGIGPELGVQWSALLRVWAPPASVAGAFHSEQKPHLDYNPLLA